MILFTSPRVVKVDRFDADVRVEGVLVEENRTARKVGHMKAFMKDFVFDIVVNRFSQMSISDVELRMPSLHDTSMNTAMSV